MDFGSSEEYDVSPPDSLLFLFRSNSNSLSVRSSPRPFLPSSFSLFPSQPPGFFVAASSNGFLLLLRSLLFTTASFHVYQPSSNLLLSLPPPPTNPPTPYSAVGFAAQGQAHYHAVFFSFCPHPPENSDLLFHIFSSPAGTWRKKAARAFSSDLPASPAVFIRDCLHWLWREHLLVV